jgi:hypothetical protein
VNQLTERSAVSAPGLLFLHDTPWAVLGSAAKGGFSDNHLPNSTPSAPDRFRANPRMRSHRPELNSENTVARCAYFKSVHVSCLRKATPEGD